MKIGIDASMLVYQGSGVASYTFNLIKSLLKYAPQNEYRVFYSSRRVPSDTRKALSELSKLGAKIYKYPFPPWLLKILWNKFQILPVEWLIGKVEYYHSSDFLRPPLLRGTKGVTTIHDLTWKIFPQFHTKGIVQAHAKKIELTIKSRDSIICDSKNTKNDLLRLYPGIKRANKVEVIYLGIDDKYKVIKDQKKISNVLNRYDLKYPANYLLYVGAIEPRKNLGRSIQVFKSLIEDKKYSDFKFLIIGRAGWKNEKVFKLIKDLKLEKKVKFVGYVGNNDLVYFYNAAKVLIYLSLYEGFGLPPLEAAKCAMPTLLYKNSSLKEVFGENYEYAKKGKETSTLKTLLINRSALNLKKYPERFSWEKTCKEYIDLFSKL